MRRTAILSSGLICFSLMGWVGPVADAQPSDRVQVIDFDYTPNPARITAGGTIFWEWDGSEPHTVSARDGSFESGEKTRGARFSFTFRTAGQFDYFCQVHPNLMTGTVTVQAAPAPPPSPRPTSAAPRPTSAAPTPAPTAARPSPSRTSAPPQTLPAPTSARPSPSAAAPSSPAARASSLPAVGPVPALASPSLSAGTAVPSASRSSAPLASLDEPRPKDRTGLAIAIALLVAAGGIGLGTTLLLRGRLARKLSSPSP